MLWEKKMTPKKPPPSEKRPFLAIFAPKMGVAQAEGVRPRFSKARLAPVIKKQHQQI